LIEDAIKGLQPTEAVGYVRYQASLSKSGYC